MHTSRRSRLAFWLGCLSGLGLPCAGLAQTSAEPAPAVEAASLAPPYRQFDKVEITGSSIVRKEQTQALPVMVFTREDIRRTGLRSVAEVLQALPSMGNFVEASQLGMVVGGYSNAAIHGLPTGTLVLVNGLRMAPFGRATMVGPERSSVDLQTLPLVDVERIEILSDGASSLYGTDAIAGVVNIILRHGRKDVEIRADLSRPDGGRGRGWSSSLSWGHGQLERDGHSFLLTLEASGRQELLASDRPYINRARYTFGQQGRRYSVDDYFFFSLFGSPATFEQRNAAGVPERWFNTLYQNGQCAGAGVPMPGQRACWNNFGPSLGIYPDENNQRLHGRTEFAVGNGMTVFGELLLGRSQSSLAFDAPHSTTSAYGLLEGSAAYQLAQQAGLDPANTRLLWQPNLPLRRVSEQTNGRLSFGLKGEHAGWDHSTQFYIARSHAQYLSSFLSSYDKLGLNDGGVWNNANVLNPLNASNPLTSAVAALNQPSPESAGTNTFYGLQLRGSRPLGNGRGAMSCWAWAWTGARSKPPTTTRRYRPITANPVFLHNVR